MNWIYLDLADRDKNGPFPARIEILSTGARLREALRRSPFFALAALLSIPIPVAHFGLVPGFLLTAIGTFVHGFTRTHRFAEPLAVPCLKCNAEISFQREAVKWPLRFRCGECWEAYRVETGPS